VFFDNRKITSLAKKMKEAKKFTAGRYTRGKILEYIATHKWIDYTTKIEIIKLIAK